MTEGLSLEEFTQAIEELPPQMKAQLAQVIGAEQEVDTVAIKLELVKFSTELRKHNQGVDWETNKQKPKRIKVEEILEDAQKIFDFIVE